VSGDDNLTLTDVTADTMVATGYNGDLTVTDNANLDNVTGGNGADSFSNLGGTGGADAASTFNGGAGNDTMTVDAADLTNRTITYDGGDGTDTLSVTTASAVGDRFTLSNVEIATFTVDSTVDARDFHGKTMNVNGDADGAVEVVTFSSANTTTVDLSGITINTGAAGVGGTTTIVNGVSAVGTTITGTNGVDVITGAAGADTINAGAGADDLDGGAGADVINAGAGDDTIDGTSGSTITLGSGNDTMTTLEGTTAAATATITDFTMGTVSAAVGGDVIDLSGTGNTADGDLYATDDDSTVTVVVEGTTAAVAWADNDVLAMSTATFASYDTKAEVATLFGAAAEFSAFVADEEATLFIAAADTGSTMVWALTESNTNTVISDAADTVSLVAVLEGVSAADLDIMVTGNTIA
jgi:Ca2+-binding RTX toxin-like protein